MEHGRVVRYAEAFTVPKMKSTLDYLAFLKIIEKSKKGFFTVIDNERLRHLIEKFAKDISDQVALNLKLSVKND